MKLSDKQQLIVNYIRQNGTITTMQANQLLSCFYYHNAAHYISEILTNMVKRRYIIRTSRGIYSLGSLGSLSNSIHGASDKTQQSLF